MTYVSIDMDLYQGVIDVLHCLKPRMRGLLIPRAPTNEQGMSARAAH